MRLTAFFALSILAAPAFAEDISKCAGIENDLDRLACYDLASGKNPTTENVITSSEWEVITETSEFEDTTDVYLNVTSEDNVPCDYDGTGTATLWVRCQENTTSLIIGTSSCHMASGIGGYGEVDIRLDDDPATILSMDESTNNRSLGLWSGGKSIPFIKKMLGKDQLITRFTPYSKSPITVKFNISGLDEAIAPLRESCGW